MSDMLTMAEIAAQFVAEWVLVEDPQTNDALEVQSGKVLSHSKDRDEVYREAVRLRPQRFAMLYTGTLPRDTAIVLCVSPFTRSTGWSLYRPRWKGRLGGPCDGWRSIRGPQAQ